MRTAKIKSWVLLACLFGTVACLLCACGRTSKVEYNGKQLTDEEIRAIGKRFETETEAEAETEKEEETEAETEAETETETETDEPADGEVHWTAGGTVWHEWRTCYRLSDRSAVITGSVDAAMEAGKEHPCTYCCK